MRLLQTAIILLDKYQGNGIDGKSKNAIATDTQLS